ncbi:MAG TPA: hypothetical protein VIJ00_08595, partial [Nakamurella sp.]
GLGGPGRVGYALVASALGVAVLSVAVGGWLPGIGPAGPPERAVAAVAALVLLWLDPIATAAGAAIAATVPLAVLLRRRLAENPPTEEETS